jgi:hypothetical protein
MSGGIEDKRIASFRKEWSWRQKWLVSAQSKCHCVCSPAGY